MLAGVLLAPAPAAASDHDRGAPDAVRRAVEAGEIKSLADILASLRDKLPGQVAGVEIERERGRWIYEFRLVDDKGRLYEAYVDARSGEIERVKEK
ncbi:PepSY domain-containing protein [Bradyrhizobium guangxiense]